MGFNSGFKGLSTAQWRCKELKTDASCWFERRLWRGGEGWVGGWRQPVWLLQKTENSLLLPEIETECVCSGSRRSVREVFVVLGWHAALIGSWLPKFRERKSIPSSKIKHLVTEISGQPICPVFKCPAFGGWLPKFRDSQSIPSSKVKQLFVGQRHFWKLFLSHLQGASTWTWDG